MYLHEMEADKPKTALPEDVAKSEARAKSHPSLRPIKTNVSAGTPTVKMFRASVVDFDFDVYYDC